MSTANLAQAVTAFVRRLVTEARSAGIDILAFFEGQRHDNRPLLEEP
jgi:hypothetical protein